MEKDKFKDDEKGETCCIEIVSKKQQDGKSTTVRKKSGICIPHCCGKNN